MDQGRLVAQPAREPREGRGHRAGTIQGAVLEVLERAREVGDLIFSRC